MDALKFLNYKPTFASTQKRFGVFPKWDEFCGCIEASQLRADVCIHAKTLRRFSKLRRIFTPKPCHLSPQDELYYFFEKGVIIPMKQGKMLLLHVQPPENGELEITQCGSQYCHSMHEYGPAVRDHYLFHYIVSGKGKFCSEGKVYDLRAGHCFLIHPNRLTIYRADKDDPWEYIWIGFCGSKAESLVRDAGLDISNPIIDDLRCKTFFHGALGSIDDDSRINADVRLDSRSNSLRACGELMRFFSYLLRRRHDQATTRPLVERAADFIRINSANDISVTRLAADFGYSRTHFSELFKRETGMSPRQYHMNYRMENAAILLETTGLNISYIAKSVGYEDALLFSRMFRKHMGKSPREWRAAHLR